MKFQEEELLRFPLNSNFTFGNLMWILIIPEFLLFSRLDKNSHLLESLYKKILRFINWKIQITHKVQFVREVSHRLFSLPVLSDRPNSLNIPQAFIYATPRLLYERW
jgi:hypothetical protein